MDRMCNCNTESVSTSARDWEAEYKKIVGRDYSAAAKMSERLCEMKNRCETLKIENERLIDRIEQLTEVKDTFYYELQYQKGLVDGLKYAIEHIK